MIQDEALRLALEALEANLANWNAKRKAIPIIKQALEQPVSTSDTSQYRVDETAKQRHEPVACNECKEWEKVCDQHLRHIKKLKAKREWQGLTDDEIDLLEELYAPPVHPDFVNDADHCTELIRHVEAKLKERNT